MLSKSEFLECIPNGEEHQYKHEIANYKMIMQHAEALRHKIGATFLKEETLLSGLLFYSINFEGVKYCTYVIAPYFSKGNWSYSIRTRLHNFSEEEIKEIRNKHNVSISGKLNFNSPSYKTKTLFIGEIGKFFDEVGETLLSIFPYYAIFDEGVCYETGKNERSLADVITAHLEFIRLEMSEEIYDTLKNKTEEEIVNHVSTLGLVIEKQNIPFEEDEY